jgi:hypothetical protein
VTEEIEETEETEEGLPAWYDRSKWQRDGTFTPGAAVAWDIAYDTLMNSTLGDSNTQNSIITCVSIRNQPLSIGDPFHSGVSYVLTHPRRGMSVDSRGQRKKLSELL